APEIWMSVRAFVGDEHSYLQRLECCRIELQRALYIAHGQNDVIKQLKGKSHAACVTGSVAVAARRHVPSHRNGVELRDGLPDRADHVLGPRLDARPHLL